MLGPQLQSPNNLHIIGLFMLGQDVLSIGVGGYFGAKSAYLSMSGEAAHGSVVEMEIGGKGSATPIVEFTTPGGKRVRFKGSVTQKPPAYRVGEQVVVYYSPSNPSYAVIDSFSEMWTLPTVFGGIGIVMTVVGGILVSVGLRRRKARAQAKATGWHLHGSVVSVTTRQLKNGVQYCPVVEVLDPQTNTPTSCTGDRQRGQPSIGAQAIVHVEPSPPHRYFVELA